ncbi:MAG: DUF3892 domain-containing protein [Eubacterium sp.]|nr:DUF3892 domain-containing protein [Eubacterium sp.]
MVYVDKVHYATDARGNELYIASVKWTNSLHEDAVNQCNKKEMIDFINAHPGGAKTKYRLYGTWREGEEIHVVDNSYLRTDNNNTKADNLGNLPRF